MAPDEPLEAMVRGQARHKADGGCVLAGELVDRPGLWTLNFPARGGPPEEGA